MNWLDLVVIYIACGMPFAVYRFALSEREPTETAVRSLWAALLWPIDGANAVGRRLRSASRSLARPRLETIRLEIEDLIAAEQTHFARFEFREVFDRYAGLARASVAPAKPAAAALSQITGSMSPKTTEACLIRTEQAKIERHVTSAREDLVAYLAISSSTRVFELAATLGQELVDPSITAELSRHSVSGKSATRPSVAQLSGSAS